MQLPTVRILVVDDFETFRQLVVELLRKRPELQVVGEASDGLEALQMAVELRPDLILLDIGLPTMNGIEAARRIRALVPESKIIFLSQESSADVIEEALKTGARGYVVKHKPRASYSLLLTRRSRMVFLDRPSRNYGFTSEHWRQAVPIRTPGFSIAKTRSPNK